MQYALHMGFKQEQIVIFGWSIGGYPATWAAVNYPNIRALILDASFDDILPLAYANMPAFAESVVEIAIRKYYNLNIAAQVCNIYYFCLWFQAFSSLCRLQLEHFRGPVRIIRRYNDEIVTLYRGADEERRRRENRGNHLLAKFIKGRYSAVCRTDDDYNAVLNYLDVSGTLEEAQLVADAVRALSSGLPPLERLDDAQTRVHIIHLLCSTHFTDVFSSHVVPLKSAEFIVPEAVDLNDLSKILRIAAERVHGF